MEVRRASRDELRDVLAVQRAAFRSEAVLYGCADLPPLTETLDDLLGLPSSTTIYVATQGERIVGTVRTRRHGRACHVERLATLPAERGRGIATGLMGHVHDHVPEGCEYFELSTGRLSTRNLSLYRRLAYVETGVVMSDVGIALVVLRRAGRRAVEAAPGPGPRGRDRVTGRPPT